MKPYELITTTLLLLALSLQGGAQERVKLELKNPTAPKAEPVKIEQINNQDILRIASPTDTIRIPLSDDIWDKLEDLMQSSVGTSTTLKDIEGADVNLLRVSMNMKPGIYFRNKKNKSISISDSDLMAVKK